MQTKFRNFGVMLDCSRNAVMTVPVLKKFITILAKMGYNQVQLYMEDTYEVEDVPHFGYLRGRYSQAELRELDEFACGLGVELVPNVQTLAHMAQFLRWRKDLVDAADILLVGEDETYELIEKFFAALRQCFRTKKIHVGMDEAVMLGRGKYFDLHGPEDRFDILLNHLRKVCEIAKKYDFSPMMWSDMFYRLANDGSYYKYTNDFDPSIKEKIPENVTLVYWDYYSHKKERYDAMLKRHRQLSDNIAFAGGAWKWMGYAPQNKFSIKATKCALDACLKNGVQDVYITLWGDDGADCSAFAVLPTLCYAACLAQGITKMDDIREKFREWVGLRYDDFLLLDLPNDVDYCKKASTVSKNFLFADPFMSLFGTLEKPEYAAKYASFARRLKLAAKRNGEYACIFDTMAKLCEVLAIKQDICSRTRQAYAERDLARMDAVLADYKKMIKRTEALHEALKKQWFAENKPFGFEVQDMRFGGLLLRMKSCMARLMAWRAGEISSIPELEEALLPFCDGLPSFNDWSGNFTTNVVF